IPSSPGAASTPASSRPSDARCSSDERDAPQAAQPRVRLRDAHDPRRHPAGAGDRRAPDRSKEHTSELQSLMRISYAVFFLKKKTAQHKKQTQTDQKSQK